jgi:hypothetical protein
MDGTFKEWFDEAALEEEGTRRESGLRILLMKCELILFLNIILLNQIKS